MNDKHIGSSFDEFLQEEGIHGEITARALKRVLAWQIAEAMREEGLTKSGMAARMGTSRASLNRLLDPDNPSVTLQTLDRAASALGRKLRVEIAEVGR